MIIGLTGYVMARRRRWMAKKCHAQFLDGRTICKPCAIQHGTHSLQDVLGECVISK